MNVKFENVSKVQGLLTVSMEKADYQENVDKALKDAGLPSGNGPHEPCAEDVRKVHQGR